MKYWFSKWKYRLGKAKEEGWVWLFSKDYREYCNRRRRNRKATLRGRKVYGYNFMNNAAAYKELLFHRNGDICFYCGNKLTWETANIDHINPVKDRFKGNKIENLRLIHEKCHVEKNRIENKSRNLTP